MALMSSFEKIRSSIDKVRDFCFATDLRKGVTASVSGHLLIGIAIAATMIDWNREVEKEDPELTLSAFQISSPSSAVEDTVPLPAVAPPTAKKNATGEPSDAPVAEVAFQEGGSGNMTIWTPPPPERPISEGQLAPNPLAGKAMEGPSSSIPLIEFVQMEGDQGSPVLVSFDAGTFSASDALAEATRLQGSGSMKMLVVVEKTGTVIGCSIVESSGSNILDDLGCGLVMTYRYEPAKDKEGQPKDAMVYEALEWSDGKMVERVDSTLSSDKVDEDPKTP